MKNLNPRSAEAVIILKKSVTLLNRADKKKLGWIAGVQILLSILDLLGVIIIGLITALAVSALTAQVPGNRLSNVLNFFEIKDNSPQIQALILGIVAAALLIIKTLVSLKLTKKSLYFLNIKAALYRTSVSIDLARRNKLCRPPSSMKSL
jgi:ATP-binding cassette subfamily C protein